MTFQNAFHVPFSLFWTMVVFSACNTNSSIPFEEGVYQPLELSNLEDPIVHDSLLVHNTFDLSGGQALMVARSTEEDFEGLKLYLLRDVGGNTRVVSNSTGAYDSWTYIPTIFVSPNGRDTLILAETGERESWGARLIRLKGGLFTDLGFVDMAVRASKFDELEEKEVEVLRSVVPYTGITCNNGTLFIEFNTSVHVFDDGQGGLDTLYPANAIHYVWDEALKLERKASS